MSFVSLEFELPLFSLIFLLLLSIFYYSKKRVNIVENECYDMIIVFSFVETILSTVVHFICATHHYNDIVTFYYNFINFANKIITTSFVAIFAYFLLYILVITFSYVRENFTKYRNYVILFISFFFILTLFTRISLVSFNSVTNVKGSTPILGYIFIAVILFISLVFSIKNIKNIDKRYYAIFVIIPLMVFGYLLTIFVPQIIVYDIIITVFCYIIFFTIENPDMKLLKELHNAKEISDSANEEKTIFLYNMTQEIRNITGKINDEANEILSSKASPQNKDSARSIIAITSQFNNLTNDVLDVSMLDDNNIKVYNNKYSIKNILKQLINVYSDICKDKELKFITNIDHDIPDMLYGDSIGLKEVLNIVLSNSTKYTNNGYIEFNVNTIIKNDVCRIIMTIEDSGSGIKGEDINKIKVGNNALGKANKLITLMNGAMIISSDYGMGTKVKIILDQRIEKTENKEINRYESQLDNIKILCVDDNEAGLKIIDKLLKLTNIFVDKAETGKECLDKLKMNKYDLILLDEELSQISGMELMSKIREIRNFKTPVVLLTKDNNYEYNEEYLKVGFSDYLLKPLKKEKILQVVDKYTKR